MILILCISILVVLLVGFVFELYLTHSLKRDLIKLSKQYEADNSHRHIAQMAEDDLLREISEYAVNKGLECLIMPDQLDKPTLFIRDTVNDTIIPLCNIPQVEKSSGAPYSKAVELLQGIVNKFIEDNPKILENKNEN